MFFEFLFHHELLSSRHIHLSRQHPQDTLAGKVVYRRSDGRRVGGHLADAVSSALVDDKREWLHATVGDTTVKQYTVSESLNAGI